MGSLCCTQRHRAHVDYILDDTLAAQPEIEDITQSTTEQKVYILYKNNNIRAKVPKLDMSRNTLYSRRVKLKSITSSSRNSMLDTSTEV